MAYCVQHNASEAQALLSCGILQEHRKCLSTVAPGDYTCMLHLPGGRKALVSISSNIRCTCCCRLRAALALQMQHLQKGFECQQNYTRNMRFASRAIESQILSEDSCLPAGGLWVSLRSRHSPPFKSRSMKENENYSITKVGPSKVIGGEVWGRPAARGGDVATSCGGGATQRYILSTRQADGAPVVVS
jgi:hypothetical protein